ncbi:MAG: hypothetical protein CL424_16410 [Acidimicrobiaceae bacterium]|nr:hypothetical protein [Acidimicrobiaceae bacterium]
MADPVVGAAALTPAEFAPLAAEVTVELDTPAQLRLVATTDGHEVTTPFTTEADTSFALPLAGLYSDRSYDVAVHALVDGDEITLDTPEPLVFDTPPLPDWMPAHTVESDPTRVSPGYVLVESSPNQIDTGQEPDPDADPVYPTNVSIVYDEAGEIVWYYTNQGLGGVEQTTDGTFVAHYGPFGAREFDVLGNVIGHWRPAFAEGVGSQTPGALPDGNPGDAAPLTVDAPWTELRSFHHEVRPMGNGNLIALSAALHDLTPEQREAICPGDDLEFKAVSDVIVEFTPDGEVIRTWDLWDVVDIVEVPGSDMCFTDGGLFATEINRDWTHANSVIYDPTRDAIVISARHTDQIIALDHLDDEGPQSQLRWIIGAGGTIPFEGDLPYHQHAVELMDNGDYIFYDNGNDRPGTDPDDPANPPYSRAAVYSVDDSSDDPADWTATQVWEHIDVEEDGTPVFTSFISDADILANGNVLITHGGIGPFPPSPEFPLRALVVEVVKGGEDEGDVVWRLDSDPFQSHTMYRSEKVETFYVGDEWSTDS